MSEPNYTPNTNPYNSSSYGGYNQSGYASQSSGGYFSSYKRINLLEIGVVLFSIIAVLVVLFLGWTSQESINRDKQRQQDIAQIAGALDEFYKNSSTIPSERAYPKAVCSESLNEVDYEFTLKRHLTGQVTSLDTHAYINSDDYPKDRTGVYSKTFKDRQIPYRCTEKLNLAAGATTDTQIYQDGSLSCNFNQAKNLNKCYLYTSTNNGDTYKIGYWKESSGSFVTFRKFRDEAIQIQV